MNIRELLNENMIEIGAELSTKDEALERLIELQKDSGVIRSAASLSREIKAREELGSGAVSMRVAISAVRHRGARRTGISAMTLREGVDYDAPDKRPVKLLFMISGRDGTDDDIRLKARLLHLLMDSEFTARLCAANSKKEFMDLIAQREKTRYAPVKPNKRYDCSKYIISDTKGKHERLITLKSLFKRSKQ